LRYKFIGDPPGERKKILVHGRTTIVGAIVIPEKERGI